MLKLWKISQTELLGYDTYDSAVVAAYTAEEARATYPRTGRLMPLADREGPYLDWPPTLDAITVTYLGVAAPEVAPGVILASFNAG